MADASDRPTLERTYEPDWATNAVCDHLRRQGELNEDSADHVWRSQTPGHEPFELVLNRAGVISDDALARAYAALSGFDVDEANAAPARPVKIEGLSISFLKSKEALPLRLEGETLILGVVNPLDQETVAGVAFAAQAPVEPRIMLRGRWRRAFARLYEQDWDADETSGADERIDALIDQTRDAPAARRVASWLAEAIDRAASDIHVEPREAVLQVRLRVDGQLETIAEEPLAMADAVISRIKVIAELDLGERRAPQDGRVTAIIGGRPVDVRVSIVPSVYGESAVMRLLDKAELTLDFETLGLTGEAYDCLTAATRFPHGVFLITGPTGSGKTTTLYAALEAMRGDARKILTIEDPVEYHFDHVIQCQLAEKAGLTFAGAVRAYLRQDPDVIVVGEIRDRETARAAVQAALTGHLVLATVHAIDARRVVPRLVEMGVERYQLAACFRGALAQRLVRKLCLSCRVERAVTPSDRDRLGSAKAILGETIYEAQGCARCGGTGYRGRMAIAEAFLADDRYADAIRAGSELSDTVSGAADDYMRMLEIGARQVSAGATTIEDVLRAVSA